ncbi:MAG: hypothetical protein DHS20C11_10230 [Lysobacteraceae bacterium]|nr:MAG: hypothetical protein DHS20C11_10230 [Xanthomonadaceae bacterium]
MSDPKSALAGQRLYIVLLPATFSTLRWCIYSLLEHLPFNLVLVGNGIDRDEAKRLDRLCNGHSRLSFVAAFDVVQAHGIALDYAFKLDQQPWFAFADSDVAALEPLSDWLAQQIASHDVFSSCTIAKNAESLVRRGFGGQATISPSGKAVAASYFSVYRRAPVSQLMARYGISFKRHHPRRLPSAVVEQIDASDITEQNYDTGKLLSLMASYTGLRVGHENHKALLHLGGMSKDFSGGDERRDMRRNHERIQTYFRQVLTNPPDVEVAAPSLDQQWKVRNTVQSGRKLKVLMAHLQQRYASLEAAWASP